MQLVKVYEAGAGKWVKIHEGDVCYVLDRNDADSFSLDLLTAADQCFGDFSIYKHTLHAVPYGSNQQPWDCLTVKNHIKTNKEK